jgi:branched-chain amino acid transport system substrate-binding protein
MAQDIRRRRILQAAAATSIAIGTRRAHAEPPEVKVAVLAPLSGAWARQGLLMKEGAEMAIDDINAAGGIKALGGAKMKLMLFDAGDSAEKAKDAAQRMVAQQPDLTGGSGAWLSSFTLAVTEVTERAQLPWLTLSYSDAITSRGFRYVFQTSETANKMAEDALPTIMKLADSAGSKPTTVGIVSDNTASNISFLKPIRESELTKFGLKLVVDETYTPPLSDASTMVQRVRSRHPNFLLLLSSNVPDNKLMLDSFNEFGLGHGKLPLVGSGAALAASEMNQVVGKDIIDGLLVIVSNWGGKGQEDLAKRFVARTKEPWLGQDSIQTYFDMSLLKYAVEQAGTADRNKVADVLRSIDITDGPAQYLPGRRVKFDDKGRLVGASLVIVQWQDGIAVPVYPPAVATDAAIWPKA